MTHPGVMMRMETIPSAKAPISVAQTAPLRDVYLRRLQRLVRLRRQHERDLNSHGIRLLDRSIFAAYYECRDAGIGQEALQLLHEAPFLIDQSTNAFSMADGGSRAGPQALPGGGAWGDQPEG